MPLVSASIQAMRPGVFAELQRQIDAFRARGGDLIPLHIGDTVLTPPMGARFALAEGMGKGDFGGQDNESAEFDEALYRYGDTAGLLT
ncbi:MAG: hypothetical protein NVS3B20_09160 [Polyangiales bacterium]